MTDKKVEQLAVKIKDENEWETSYLCYPPSILEIRVTIKEVSMKLMYQDLTKKIIGAFFEVSNTLGPGLPEKPYHRALYKVLVNKDLKTEFNFQLPIMFEGDNIGTYYADLVVEKKVIIEVKAVNAFSNLHRSQLLNYMRLSDCKAGLLVNFFYNRCTFERLVL